MRKSTLNRFNSDQGAGNYKKKFDTKATEKLKNFFEQRFIEQQLSEVTEIASEAETWALDMPCGIGRFYPSLKAQFDHVVQADWSGPMLEISREEHGAGAAGFLRVSALDLPFDNQRFDLVYSVRLCHHLPTLEERQQYLGELFRISKSWVVLSFLDTYSPHNMYRSFSRWLQGKPLKWHISTEEVAEVAEKHGFVVVSTSLLSRIFSGQRYMTLKRVAHGEERVSLQVQDAGSAASKAAPVDHAPMAGVPVAVSYHEASRFERFCRQIPVWRGVVIFALLLACLFLDVGSMEMDQVLLPMGITIYAVGACLRSWAQLHQTSLRREHAFSRSGPYRWMRHPLYLGNLGMIMGLAIFAENVYLMPFVVLVAATLYVISARQEEARLLRLGGPEYQAYRETVSAWLPGFPKRKGGALAKNTLGALLGKTGYVLLGLVPFILFELFYT